VQMDLGSVDRLARHHAQKQRQDLAHIFHGFRAQR